MQFVRDTYLVRLADALRPVADPVAIQQVATRLLGEHLGAGRVLYAEISDDGLTGIVAADRYRSGAGSAVGRHRLDDFGPFVREMLRTGRTLVVEDVRRLPGVTPEELAAHAALGVAAHVTVPLIKDGRLSALLTVHAGTARAWTAEDVALIEETAERTWAAVARARAEQALRESEAKYRSLFERIDEGFCVVEVLFDGDGRAQDYRFLEVNPVFERQTGLTGAVGRTARELVPGLEATWFEVYGRVALTGEATRFELGSEAMARWFDVYAFRIGEPEARRVAVLFTDITRRRAAEAALRDSEQRFRRMADTAPAVLWVTDPDGACTFLSHGWYELTGQTEAEALGFGWTRAVHPEDRDLARDTYLAANARQEPFALDYRLRRADGEYRWAVDSGRPRFGETGEFEGYIGSVIDIHDRKRAEEQLRQAAKMEAIGRLAGGIAHDFNNQLQAVNGFAHFAARDPGLGARARADLDEILKATERMAGLTRALLAFSRRQVLQPETLELNAAVVDGASLLRRLLGSDVEMSLDLTADPTWVRVDRAQLLQVLMNLAINARDAMAGGGRLRVRTTRVTVRDGERAGHDRLEPGIYVVLAVSDSGTGISAEHLPHIFEPFFTTKEVGQGTGLGLATVHGIVSQSRGRVSVESEPGRGSTFTVLLPAVAGPEAAAAPSEAGAEPGRRRASVLVVDDEEVVRRVMSRTLEDAGYTVVQAESAEAALAHLAQANGTVDLVLSDVVMPGLGGRVLGERLAAAHPGLPLVWMSGHPRDTALEQGAVGGKDLFLQKPIPAAVLLRTVHDVLSESAESRRG